MTHLEHPTQAAACGRNVRAVPVEAFRAATDQCGACARVLAAADAGRPYFSGYDDGHGDRGARRAKRG